MASEVRVSSPKREMGNAISSFGILSVSVNLRSHVHCKGNLFAPGRPLVITNTACSVCSSLGRHHPFATSYTEYLIYFYYFIFILFLLFLFERSEFLIATCKKKKTDRLSVCPDVRLILVLVLGRQIAYGQNTVYLCLSRSYQQPVQQYKHHHVVRSIARSGVSPPGARSDGHHWCQAARTAATCT